MLGGGGLDADVVWVSIYDVGKTLLHGKDMRIHLGPFGTDGSVEVDEAVAFGGYQLDCLLKDNLAVHAVSLGSGIGEVVADVAHVSGTKHSVANSMYQYVGVAVAEETKANRPTPCPSRRDGSLVSLLGGEHEWNLDTSQP